jgi:hypothetical protein
MILDGGAAFDAWVDSEKISPTDACVKYSHPRRARREHSSLEVTTEAGWQLLSSHHEGGGAACAQDGSTRGPLVRRRRALLCRCAGNFVGCSLSLVRSLAFQSTVQRRSASTQLTHSRLSPTDSRRLSHAICLRRLFTATGYRPRRELPADRPQSVDNTR